MFHIQINWRYHQWNYQQAPLLDCYFSKCALSIGWYPKVADDNGSLSFSAYNLSEIYLARFIPSFYILFGDSRSPAVSYKCIATPLLSIVVYNSQQDTWTISLVVPGSLLTIEISFLERLLINVLFPTLGLPMMAILMPSLTTCRFL